MLLDSEMIGFLPYMKKETILTTPVPLRLVGPVLINSEDGSFEVDVPLATYESPLWPSVRRGAAVTKYAGGITTTITHDAMARSVVFDARTARRALDLVSFCQLHRQLLFDLAQKTSTHLVCTDISCRIVGSCVYLRLSATTGDASGHNMITKASEAILQWICQEFPDLHYISVSGNYCTDKKVSSVNAILGRGKSVVAESLISRKACQRYLKTSPEAICELNTKKNLLGSIINGGVQSANAHFANMLLAIFLSTGQDVANIVEGSQGITFCEMRKDDLYFSVSLPNIIVGTCGNGKDIPSTKRALEGLGCLECRAPGKNSRRLAEITAATVLCGELSLLAAQTRPGELVQTHMTLERNSSETSCSRKKL
jgi:hydroxymethylglutaryl-CoA reductase (NADPH)